MNVKRGIKKFNIKDLIIMLMNVTINLEACYFHFYKGNVNVTRMLQECYENVPGMLQES
jgi:hypothetical protein